MQNFRLYLGVQAKVFALTWRAGEAVFARQGLEEDAKTKPFPFLSSKASNGALPRKNTSVHIRATNAPQLGTNTGLNQKIHNKVIWIDIRFALPESPAPTEKPCLHGIHGVPHSALKLGPMHFHRMMHLLGCGLPGPPTIGVQRGLTWISQQLSLQRARCNQRHAGRCVVLCCTNV